MTEKMKKEIVISNTMEEVMDYVHNFQLLHFSEQTTAIEEYYINSDDFMEDLEIKRHEIARYLRFGKL